MPHLSGAGALLFVSFLGSPALTNAAENIDMSEVRALAALSVKEIFRDPPVHELPRASYWKTIRESPIPVVVMFYSNVDPESQRLATLVRYVAVKYKDKVSAYRVMVVEKGKPPKVIAADYEKSYSLDKTPGTFFYDDDSGKMALELQGVSHAEPAILESLLQRRVQLYRQEHPRLTEADAPRAAAQTAFSFPSGVPRRELRSTPPFRSSRRTSRRRS